MADAIISDLSAATLLAAADLFEIEQGVNPSNSSKKATLTQIQTFTQQTPFQSVSAVAGVLTLDLAGGLNQYFTTILTANITSIVFTNPPIAGTGREITVLFKQDGTGGRTVAFPASFSATGSTQTTVATAASAETLLNAVSTDNGAVWKYILVGTVVGIGGTSWAITKKAANEARTASVTLTNDSTLLVNLTSGTIYHVHAKIFYSIANATMDFKYQWTYSSTTTTLAIHSRNMPAGTAAGTDTETVRIDLAQTTVIVLSTALGTGFVEADIVITPSGNGTLSFQWAQNTSDAGACTVLGGSYLEVLQ
jgi:hypothetical protein